MIKFLKIRDVKTPKRNIGDAGIDFFVPNYSKQFEKDLRNKNKNIFITEQCFSVEPHGAVLIPTGIKSEFSDNIVLVSMNKSGICTKTQLVVGACVIDSSYQGEWHIHLINTSNTSVAIEYGTKIVQFVPIELDTELIQVFEDIPESEFFTTKSDRGEGGFGSTGIK